MITDKIERYGDGHMDTQKYGYANRITAEDFNSLCTKIAKQLNMSIVRCHKENTSCEIGEADMIINLHVWHNKPDRISVTARSPSNSKNERPDEKQVAISASLNKSAEKIAADIRNRLLPTYKERLEKVLERIKNENEYYSNQNNLLESAAKIVGANITDWEKRKNGFNFYIKDNFTCVQASDALEVTLSGLTLEQFEHVVEYLHKT